MPLFELSDIAFGYADQPKVLEGASLVLEPSERVCITGPNGAGKSTLLQIMVGLQTPSRGQIHAFGARRQTEADFHDVRLRAGLIFQDPDDQLFCPTVADDIAFGPLNMGHSRTETAAIVTQVLARLDLEHLRDRITYKLSGGEKRLVTLATVLAMTPEVLLLDEPTNALDAENRARLIEILQSLPQAMVVISHDAGFRQQIGTRTLNLSGGRLRPMPDPGSEQSVSKGPAA